MDHGRGVESRASVSICLEMSSTSGSIPTVVSSVRTVRSTTSGADAGTEAPLATSVVDGIIGAGVDAGTEAPLTSTPSAGAAVGRSDARTEASLIIPAAGPSRSPSTMTAGASSGTTGASSPVSWTSIGVGPVADGGDVCSGMVVGVGAAGGGTVAEGGWGAYCGGGCAYVGCVHEDHEAGVLVVVGGGGVGRGMRCTGNKYCCSPASVKS